jgi:hypothetical protein
MCALCNQNTMLYPIKKVQVSYQSKERKRGVEKLLEYENL